MRKVLVSLALASLLAGTSGAFAVSPTVTKGVIKSFDAKACTVTLDVNNTYQFAPKCDFSKLKVGEKVAVTWTMKGKTMNAVMIVKAA